MTIVQKFVRELLPVWTQRKNRLHPAPLEPVIQSASMQAEQKLRPAPKPVFKPKPRSCSDYASNM